MLDHSSAVFAPLREICWIVASSALRRRYIFNDAHAVMS